MTRPNSAKKKPVKPVGSVAFVGAGPGDPELLTVRAVDLLARADVVVTESQDETFVRRFCRPDVEVVDGSLGDDGQPLSHAVRARLVVKAAKSGGLVVRLLDGDPFPTPPAPRRRPAARRPASSSRSCPASRRSPRSRRTPASR